MEVFQDNLSDQFTILLWQPNSVVTVSDYVGLRYNNFHEFVLQVKLHAKENVQVLYLCWSDVINFAQWSFCWM